jgi:hypothetical protein
VVSAPDDSPLHFQLQELVQERVRSVRSPSVVKEIEKLLVGAVDVELGVVGQLTEGQIEKRRHGHPALAIQPFLPVAKLFPGFLSNFPSIHISILIPFQKNKNLDGPQCRNRFQSDGKTEAGMGVCDMRIPSA